MLNEVEELAPNQFVSWGNHDDFKVRPATQNTDSIMSSYWILILETLSFWHKCILYI